jgi:hypothetical protein
MKLHKLSEVGMKDLTPYRVLSIKFCQMVLGMALLFTIIHIAVEYAGALSFLVNPAVLAGILVAGAAIRLIYALFTGK